MYIKPKIYHSLDNATMKALYNIYIVPDIYYCNKYDCVYTHIIQCSQCHNCNVIVVPHARRSLSLCVHRMTLPYV